MKRRGSAFEISVEATEEKFMAAPTAAQRELILRRALQEMTEDIAHLDRMAPVLVSATPRPPIAGDWTKSPATLDVQSLVIEGQQVMQAWEQPIMTAMAATVGRTGGDILEIGFGMGISATAIVEHGVRSYTVCEYSDSVASSFVQWKARYPDQNIKIMQGRWQDRCPDFETYDGIFFDAYASTQLELDEELAGPWYALAAEFFPTASRCLRPGGVFTYFSCEVDTLSRSHQRLLLQHFDSFSVKVVRGVAPPEGCQYWWADSMVVVEAFKHPR